MLTLVVLLAFTSLLRAQDPWAEPRKKNPPEIEFSLRLVDAHTYRQGELVRAEVGFPKPPSERPPKEIWGFAGVLLDPAAGCGTVEELCTVPYVRFMKFDPMPGMRGRTEPVTITLNNYLPRLPPGRYQAAFLARKQVLKAQEPMSATYGYADPPALAVSNAVEFEIVSASEKWIAETVARCVKTLGRPESPGHSSYELRRAAAEQLSFLDHPAAWSASVDLLPTESGRLLAGLATSEEPARVCRLMRQRMTEPRQVVSFYYMARMPGICGDSQEHRAAYAALASSLGRKQADAKAYALETLIRRVQHLRLNEPGEPEPDWIPVLRREFIKSLPGFDLVRQRLLLGTMTGTFVWPELAPVLESLLDAWKPGDYYETPRTALRALNSMDPKRAQAKILEEMLKPQTWLNAGQLEMLPASAVPSMDDALIEALAQAQRPGGWDAQLRMAALARYATTEALPRMRAIYESQQQPCQPELMAYFVRVDPEYAGRVFRSEEWDMLDEPPPCTVQYFERTAPLAMHPVLEEYMAAYLMHRTVLVKRAAARSLGQYGSAEAIVPLWGAFRYFHRYWQGKGQPTYEGVELEVDLRNAIARGKNWLANQADLRLIESLCTTGRCLQETRADLHAWDGTLRIELQRYAEGVRGSVAQYRGIETIADLEAKLAQFPGGTQFVLMARGPDAQQAATEIKRFAVGGGLIVTQP